MNLSGTPRGYWPLIFWIYLLKDPQIALSQLTLGHTGKWMLDEIAVLSVPALLFFLPTLVKLANSFLLKKNKKPRDSQPLLAPKNILWTNFLIQVYAFILVEIYTAGFCPIVQLVKIPMDFGTAPKVICVICKTANWVSICFYIMKTFINMLT